VQHDACRDILPVMQTASAVEEGLQTAESACGKSGKICPPHPYVGGGNRLHFRNFPMRP
jgi:hypothetical protein